MQTINTTMVVNLASRSTHAGLLARAMAICEQFVSYEEAMAIALAITTACVERGKQKNALLYANDKAVDFLIFALMRLAQK